MNDNITDIKAIESPEFIPKEAQLKFARVYLDSSMKTSIEQACKDIGLTRQTYYDWMKTPFKQWLISQKKELIQNSLLDIYKIAIERARKGNFNFAKLILTMSGDYQEGLKLEGLQPQESIQIQIVQAVNQTLKEGDITIEDH